MQDNKKTSQKLHVSHAYVNKLTLVNDLNYTQLNK